MIINTDGTVTVNNKSTGESKTLKPEQLDSLQPGLFSTYQSMKDGTSGALPLMADSTSGSTTTTPQFNLDQAYNNINTWYNSHRGRSDAKSQREKMRTTASAVDQLLNDPNITDNNDADVRELAYKYGWRPTNKSLRAQKQAVQTKKGGKALGFLPWTVGEKWGYSDASGQLVSGLSREDANLQLNALKASNGILPESGQTDSTSQNLITENDPTGQNTPFWQWFDKNIQPTAETDAIPWVNGMLNIPYDTVKQINENIKTGGPIDDFGLLGQTAVKTALGTASFVNQTLGEPLQGGDVVGRIVDNFKTKPLSTIINGLMILQAYDSFTKSPEIKPAEAPKEGLPPPEGPGAPKGPTAIAKTPPGTKTYLTRGEKLAMDVVKPGGDNLQRAADLSRNAVRMTSDVKNEAEMSMKLDQISVQAGEIIEKGVADMDKIQGPQDLDPVIDGLRATLEKTDIGGQNPKLVNKVVTDAERELNDGTQHGEGVIKTTNNTLFNNFRKGQYKIINRNFWGKEGLSTSVDYEDYLRNEAAGYVKEVIKSNDENGVYGDLLDQQSVAIPVSKMLAERIIPKGDASGDIPTGYNWRSFSWKTAVDWVKSILKKRVFRAAQREAGPPITLPEMPKSPETPQTSPQTLPPQAPVKPSSQELGAANVKAAENAGLPSTQTGERMTPKTPFYKDLRDPPLFVKNQLYKAARSGDLDATYAKLSPFYKLPSIEQIRKAVSTDKVNLKDFLYKQQ